MANDMPRLNEPACPFCGGEIAERSVSDTGYTIWESECTALGSGSPMRPDLDEVADGLLAALGFGGSVSEPNMPVGSSGMVLSQHYDIPKSLDHLRDKLQGHGFEMRTTTCSESGHEMHSIWVRRQRGDDENLTARDS